MDELRGHSILIVESEVRSSGRSSLQLNGLARKASLPAILQLRWSAVNASTSRQP